mmetsp:Transcript_17891/g.53227  ORF Transcript_17891/g.53227 Transcript_17891/m.53227 type:complete len:312 (-) Transcript_17891:42-977(-)
MQTRSQSNASPPARPPDALPRGSVYPGGGLARGSPASLEEDSGSCSETEVGGMVVVARRCKPGASSEEDPGSCSESEVDGIVVVARRRPGNAKTTPPVGPGRADVVSVAADILDEAAEATPENARALTETAMAGAAPLEVSEDSGGPVSGDSEDDLARAALTLEVPLEIIRRVASIIPPVVETPPPIVSSASAEPAEEPAEEPGEEIPDPTAAESSSEEDSSDDGSDHSDSDGEAPAAPAAADAASDDDSDSDDSDDSFPPERAPTVKRRSSRVTPGVAQLVSMGFEAAAADRALRAASGDVAAAVAALTQ